MLKTIICISLVFIMIFGVCCVAMANGASGTWGGSGSSGTSGGTSGGEIVNPTEYKTFTELFEGITEWILSIISLLAVLMIIFGGFQYMTSAGEDQKIAEAKKTIKWAIFGLIIVLCSYAFLTAIKEILGVTTTP